MRRISSLSERPEPHGLRRLVQRINPAGNGRVHSLVDRRLGTAARAQGPWPARARASNGTGAFPESSSRHLRESGLRENCTSRLSGGRRPALRGASSDPTVMKPANKAWCATWRSWRSEGPGATGDAKERPCSEHRVGKPLGGSDAGPERSGTAVPEGCRHNRSEEPDALTRTSGSVGGPLGNRRPTPTGRCGRTC